MVEAKSEFDLLSLLKERFKAIPDERVFYTLKLRGIKPIFPETVQCVKACYAIHSEGFPITCSIVSEILGKERKSVLQSLHLLGDRKILLLLRGHRITVATGVPCLVWKYNHQVFDIYSKIERDEEEQ